MAKTSSRPNSTISNEDEHDGIPLRFGSGRWRKANQVSGIRYKICLTGKRGVGKTCIFKRLQGEDFSNSCSTLSYEYFDDNDSTIEYSVHDKNLDETDTMTFGDHYRNAHCVLLIFDVTDFTSLEYLCYEVEKIDKYQYAPDSKFVLIQNKLDMKLSKHMSYEKQRDYIGHSILRKKVDLFVQMSAKTNAGVEDFFKNDLPNLLNIRVKHDRTTFESYLEDSTDDSGTSNGNRKTKKIPTCNPM